MTWHEHEHKRPKYILADTWFPLSYISDWIKEDPKYANKVEECVLMLLVGEFPSTLEYFKPSKAVAEAAIRADPKNIGRIKNPTKELQILAVSLDHKIMWLITRPCFEAKSIAALMA